MKYDLYLLLCGGGCISKMFGMGPRWFQCQQFVVTLDLLCLCISWLFLLLLVGVFLKNDFGILIKSSRILSLMYVC